MPVRIAVFQFITNLLFHAANVLVGWKVAHELCHKQESRLKGTKGSFLAIKPPPPYYQIFLLAVVPWYAGTPFTISMSLKNMGTPEKGPSCPFSDSPSALSYS